MSLAFFSHWSEHCTCLHRGLEGQGGERWLGEVGAETGGSGQKARGVEEDRAGKRDGERAVGWRWMKEVNGKETKKKKKKKGRAF